MLVRSGLFSKKTKIMSLYEKDSIVALATPRGMGALSIIRVSGESLDGLFFSLTDIKKIRPRYVYYKQIISTEGSIPIDNVLITFFKGPSSFTGEDIIEVSCHGGDVISEKIIQELILRGCRYALPGEFSKRAFLNGKIGLTEAESIDSIIRSKSLLEAQTGLMSLEGRVKTILTDIKESLVNLLTIMEHELDFVEEEISVSSKKETKKSLNKILLLIQNILFGSLVGKQLSSGFRVALLGPPNAGKSSLFNAILGYNRAIISDEKGTTRDSLEAFLNINEVPVTLIDTAGHWKGGSSIDVMAINKTNEEIRLADVLIVLDELNPLKFVRRLKIKGSPIIYVRSKSDLKKSLEEENILSVSSLSGHNIDVLLTKISTLIRTSFLSEDVFITSKRQLVLLKKAESLLVLLLKQFDEVDLAQAASSVRNIVDILREILGEVYNEDVLNNIFKGFCVGK